MIIEVNQEIKLERSVSYPPIQFPACAVVLVDRRMVARFRVYPNAEHAI
jgi:hypothetical protein